jgi:hypothetical protein
MHSEVELAAHGHDAVAAGTELHTSWVSIAEQQEEGQIGREWCGTEGAEIGASRREIVPRRHDVRRMLNRNSCGVVSAVGVNTNITPNQRAGRRYLGAAPSKKAIQRLRERGRTILHHANKQPWPEGGEELNQTLRGWQNYFSYGSVNRAYEAVNWMVLEKARGFLRERHKAKTKTVWKQFPARTLYGAFGIYKVRRVRRVSAPWAVT